MTYDGECEICGAEGAIKRDNDAELCDTCSLLAETEPEDQNFWNERLELEDAQ